MNVTANAPALTPSSRHANFGICIVPLPFSPCIFVRQNLDRRVERLFTHDGAHIGVELVADGLARVDARVAQVVADPDEVDAARAGLLLELTVHTDERLAGHMLPHNDHIGVQRLAKLPQIVDEHLVAAVRAVAHDHVLIEPRHVIKRLLAVFGRVGVGDHARVDQREHIRQRHDAPAVDHPVEHIDAVLRLHAPDDGAVAILRRHHAVRLVAALGVAHDLAVDGRELGRAAAVAHVVRVVIQRERRADKLRVGDVDGDGCDEIIYGSCAIDHNGKGLYTTKMGHGDAIHLTHFDPSRKGLQVWDCHENKRDGSTYRDAATGEILFQIKDSTDVGRCMAADIDPTQPGVEMWSVASGGIRNVKGEVVKDRVRGLSCNMAVWWDGDLLRELLDRNRISKYNWEKGICERIAIFEGTLSNNGTKANPCLQGDIVGDWREEVLMRTTDNTALRLYVSTIPTDYRFHTFLEDPIYRISIATQNVAYNQPTQPGFYFGPELQGTVFRGCKIPKK